MNFLFFFLEEGKVEYDWLWLKIFFYKILINISRIYVDFYYSCFEVDNFFDDIVNIFLIWLV